MLVSSRFFLMYYKNWSCVPKSHSVIIWMWSFDNEMEFFKSTLIFKDSNDGLQGQRKKIQIEKRVKGHHLQRNPRYFTAGFPADSLSISIFSSKDKKWNVWVSVLGISGWTDDWSSDLMLLGWIPKSLPNWPKTWYPGSGSLASQPCPALLSSFPGSSTLGLLCHFQGTMTRLFLFQDLHFFIVFLCSSPPFIPSPL